MSPVWLEKPKRIAVLTRRTVLGVLVYSIIQRQVRLSLQSPAQQLPGNKGLTATPTAAVVLALFAHGALLQRCLDGHVVVHVYGLVAHPLRLCDALGLDHSWYTAPLAEKTAGTLRPLERGKDSLTLEKAILRQNRFYSRNRSTDRK